MFFLILDFEIYTDEEGIPVRVPVASNWRPNK